MDIFNRPPSVADDTVAYELYPSDAVAHQKDAVTALATVIREWVDTQIPGHIWHRDAFELKVARNADVSDKWMLEGRMRVGDCVDDEWLVAWLLREASRHWDIVVSIFDTDGEFLLIEAADSLPEWVTPSNAENRVWIYQAQLHLVPLLLVSASAPTRRRSRYFRTRDSDDEGGEIEAKDFLSVADALRFVRNPEFQTVGGAPLQDNAFKRVSSYPNLAKLHIHTTRVHLPIDVARALSVNPSLVQRAAEAFYTRDALQLRAANRMTRFPPEPSVITSVKITRTAYAQLIGQTFYPPKPFGRWQEVQGSPEWRRRDVGMKIACGFEMLYQESKGRGEFAANGIDTSISARAAQIDALRRDTEYQEYVRKLVNLGYFQGQIEGSQLWQKLEARASHVFLECSRDSDATRPSFAALVNGALGAVDDTSYTAALGKIEEDSDAWLDVNEADVDAIIQKHGDSLGAGTNSQVSDAMLVDGDIPVSAASETDVDRDPAVDAATNRLQQLASKVGRFVDGSGDVEGALFEDERLSDNDSGDDSDIVFSEDDSADDNSVDSEAEAQARQEALDKLVPPLEAGEYGKMPASFYENSQRVAPIDLTDERVETPAVEETSKNTGKDPDSPPTPTGSRPIRGPILTRDRWDGVDSDDETDEEDLRGDGPLQPEALGEDEDEDEEDQPQVVGEIEIDMEEEQEEFLQFARDALGISNEMWNRIVRERLDSGAYVPVGSSANAEPQSSQSSSSSSRSEPKMGDGRLFGSLLDASAAESAAAGSAGGETAGTRRLDTFEAVMDAMDEKLATARNLRNANTNASSSAPAAGIAPSAVGARGSVFGDSKGKERAVEVEDIDAAMDAELRASLGVGNGDGDDDDERLEPGDYGLIKNFLESFKAQGGLAGPVSNLVGRLEPGWRIPRDSDQA